MIPLGVALAVALSGTVWQMWVCFEPRRPCSVRWPSIPRSPYSSVTSPWPRPKFLTAVRTARAHVREPVRQLGRAGTTRRRGAGTTR